MRTNLIAAIAVVLLAGWGIWDYMQDRNEQEAISQQQQLEHVEVGIKIGNRAPDFELLDLNGQPVKLSDFAGKKVMVNFWASWCLPCKAEMPYMEKLYNAYRNKVVVLAVNLTKTEKKQSDVPAFVEKLGLSFPVVLDEKGDVAETYQVFAYPTSYMIDSQGIIQYIYRGAITYDMMKKAINSMQ